MREATIITAYFEIVSKHTSSEYDAWIQNTLSLTDLMIIFTEAKFVGKFLKLRKHATNRTKSHPSWHMERADVLNTEIIY